MQRIEKHLPLIWKLALVAGGIQAHRWIAKNLSAQWDGMPRTALLSIADATAFYGVYCLLTVKSWEAMARDCDKSDAQPARNGEIGRVLEDETVPQKWLSKKFELAVWTPNKDLGSFPVGNDTPDGPLHVETGSVACVKRVCDLYLCISPSPLARAGFFGYLNAIEPTWVLQEMEMGAVFCARQWARENWGWDGNFIGAAVRNLTEKQRTRSYGATYLIAASATGKTTLFILREGAVHKTLAGEEGKITSATYLLKPGDLVAIVDAKEDTPILHVKPNHTELNSSLVDAFKKAVITFQVPAN